MVGRGAQGNPWIFRVFNHFLETGERLCAPDAEEIHSVMQKHLNRLHDFYGERTGVRVARKHIGWYLKGRSGTKSVLYDLMRVQTPQAQLQLLEQHFLAQSKMAA